MESGRPIRMKKRLKGNVRDAALQLLIDIEEGGSYSNLALNEVIQTYELNEKDRRLLTQLVYGTLQMRDALDYRMSPYVRGKLSGWVRQLLRLSVYQLDYLTRIPDRAVVYEAVEIAKRRGHQGIVRTVNGILRSYLRSGGAPFEAIENPVERLATETSHPLWMIEAWVEQYGFEVAEDIAFANNTVPERTARINRTQTTDEEVLEELTDFGYAVEKHPYVDVAILLEEGSFASSFAFREGRLSIQDASSMLAVDALEVEEHMTVLDLCAAPGGKTTYIAESMNNTGKVYAHDIHGHKISKIEEQANRLRLTNIEASELDGVVVKERYEPNTFDRILIDAPCSGLGVIRRKPEIKYTKAEEDVIALSHLQFKLVKEAIPLLKTGGTLVYSTCTIDQRENEKVVERVLSEFPNMKLKKTYAHEQLQLEEEMIQLLPNEWESDGFFIAAFVKQE